MRVSSLLKSLEEKKAQAEVEEQKSLLYSY